MKLQRLTTIKMKIKSVDESFIQKFQEEAKALGEKEFQKYLNHLDTVKDKADRIREEEEQVTEE